MRRILGLALAVVLLIASTSQGAVIRSWANGVQRGGDLANPGAGVSLEYNQFRSLLTSRGHTILPGVASLSAANLAGVNVFFWGTRSGTISAGEASALADFVRNGGCVIIEANSLSSEQVSANSGMSALGLGSPYNGLTGGANGAAAGLFTNNLTTTLVGPLGDLRGLLFGTSIAADITPGTGILVGTNGPIRSMVEYSPFGAGGGHVLAAGDPYGFSLFYPGGSLGNVNNGNAYLNFIENCAGDVRTVPEPASVATWAVFGLAVGLRAAWRRKVRTA
jgi:hypothetical protein